MIKKEGLEAQDQAMAWGCKTIFIDRVAKTLHGEYVECRWVYTTAGWGRCVTCGNWDHSGVSKDDLGLDAST